MQKMDAKKAFQRTRRLKRLINEGIELQKVVNQQSDELTLSHVQRLVEESNEIIGDGHPHERAECTNEVILDMQVLKMNHEVVSSILKKSSKFDDMIYHNAIAKLVWGGEDSDWDCLAKIACGIARTVRSTPSMFGAVDLQPQPIVAKERKKQQRRTQLAEATTVESVDHVQRQDKGASKVNIIHHKLSSLFKQNDNTPVPFYKLVIVPGNFMATVENAFQIAFLVRDNLIGIGRDEDGYPNVRMLSLDESKQKIETKQSLCSLDYKFVQDMIEYYDIKDPMLTLEDSDEEK